MSKLIKKISKASLIGAVLATAMACGGGGGGGSEISSPTTQLREIVESVNEQVVVSGIVDFSTGRTKADALRGKSNGTLSMQNVHNGSKFESQIGDDGGFQISVDHGSYLMLATRSDGRIMKKILPEVKTNITSEKVDITSTALAIHVETKSGDLSKVETATLKNEIVLSERLFSSADDKLVDPETTVDELKAAINVLSLIESIREIIEVGRSEVLRDRESVVQHVSSQDQLEAQEKTAIRKLIQRRGETVYVTRDGHAHAINNEKDIDTILDAEPSVTEAASETHVNHVTASSGEASTENPENESITSEDTLVIPEAERSPTPNIDGLVPEQIRDVATDLTGGISPPEQQEELPDHFMDDVISIPVTEEGPFPEGFMAPPPIITQPPSTGSEVVITPEGETSHREPEEEMQQTPEVPEEPKQEDPKPVEADPQPEQHDAHDLGEDHTPENPNDGVQTPEDGGNQSPEESDEQSSEENEDQSSEEDGDQSSEFCELPLNDEMHHESEFDALERRVGMHVLAHSADGRFLATIEVVGFRQNRLLLTGADGVERWRFPDVTRDPSINVNRVPFEQVAEHVKLASGGSMVALSNGYAFHLISNADTVQNTEDFSLRSIDAAQRPGQVLLSLNEGYLYGVVALSRYGDTFAFAKKTAGSREVRINYGKFCDIERIQNGEAGALRSFGVISADDRVNKIVSMDMDARGKCVVVGCTDRIIVHDIEKDREILNLPVENGVKRVEISNDGATVLAVVQSKRDSQNSGIICLQPHEYVPADDEHAESGIWRRTTLMEPLPHKYHQAYARLSKDGSTVVALLNLRQSGSLEADNHTRELMSFDSRDGRRLWHADVVSSVEDNMNLEISENGRYVKVLAGKAGFQPRVHLFDALFGGTFPDFTNRPFITDYQVQPGREDSLSSSISANMIRWTRMHDEFGDDNAEGYRYRSGFTPIGVASELNASFPIHDASVNLPMVEDGSHMFTRYFVSNPAFSNDVAVQVRVFLPPKDFLDDAPESLEVSSWMFTRPEFLAAITQSTAIRTLNPTQGLIGHTETRADTLRFDFADGEAPSWFVQNQDFDEDHVDGLIRNIDKYFPDTERDAIKARLRDEVAANVYPGTGNASGVMPIMGFVVTNIADSSRPDQVTRWHAFPFIYLLNQ